MCNIKQWSYNETLDSHPTFISLTNYRVNNGKMGVSTGCGFDDGFLV